MSNSRSEEVKARISNSLKGRPRSEETKKKIGDAHRGSKRSDECKRNISHGLTGRKLSEETKKKMSERKKKSYTIHNKNTDETFVVNDLIQWCKDNNQSYDPIQKSRYRNRYTRSGYKILNII